jgi:predicted GTPase
VFNCIIMGAAGRDFHDFNTFFVKNPGFHVCAFTATQIPFITERSFPREMAGAGYTADIPIHDEAELPALIQELHIDFVFFAYSDLSHLEVMHKASIVQAAGASFVLLGPGQTALQSGKKVIAITATRTGAGKSPLTQWLASSLCAAGIKAITIRHPMPYGNLKAQAVQRFASLADLDRHECTIEEREEYEPYIRQELVIFAGVDYAAILRAAEQEADMILWDGGNNDFPFVKADLNIVVADALRAGHGLDYYPGETNFRKADILVINKVADASAADIETIELLHHELNPAAEKVWSDLEVSIEEGEIVRGKNVLVIEDGPTVTHGGMGYGAGWVAAQKYGAAKVLDPEVFAVGSIRETCERYEHLREVLPAMGYSDSQRRELKATIEASGAELILNASPAHLAGLLELSVPVVQVSYRFVIRRGADILARAMQLAQQK